LRRLRRKNKSNVKLMIIFFFTLFFISVGYSIFYDELVISGKGNIVINIPSLSKNYSVTSTIDSWYDNGYFYYNCDAYLNNIGTADINGWTIQVNIPSDINEITCWNSSCTIEGNVLTITNLDYNGSVPAGQSVNFGMHFSSPTEWEGFKDVSVNGEQISGGNTGGGSGSGSGGNIENPVYATIPSTFENGDDGWRATSNATVSVESATINDVTTQALSVIENTTDGVTASIDLSQFTPGEYNISAMVGRDASAPTNIPIQLLYSYNGGQLVEIVSGDANPGSWSTLEGNLTIPEDITSLELYIVYPGNEEGSTYLAYPVFIDNVNLEKINNPDEPILYATIPSTFENGNDGWQAVDTATVAVESATVNDVTTQALSVSGDTGNGIKANLDLSQFGPGVYTYSALVARGGYGGTIDIQLLYSYDGGELIEASTGTASLGEWNQLEGTITIPENASSVELYIKYAGNENGLFLGYPLIIDNVTLEKEEEKPIIVISDFEDGTDGWTAVNVATVAVESVTIDDVTTNALSMREHTEGGVKVQLDLNQFGPGNYTYRAMVSRGAYGATIDVELWYSYNGGELISAGVGTASMGTWTQLEGSITIPQNASLVELYVVFPGNENGTYLGHPLLIDNVSLQKK